MYNRFRTSKEHCLDLKKINIPTLIISHKEDKCRITPPKGAQKIYSELSKDIKKELKYFKGGENLAENSCKANTYHGYYGIEKEVVTYICHFIKKNLQN